MNYFVLEIIVKYLELNSDLNSIVNKQNLSTDLERISFEKEFVSKILNAEQLKSLKNYTNSKEKIF